MRYSIALLLPVALAARTVVSSFQTDKTPATAPELSVIEEENSSIVKLDCIGCPFRLRTRNKWEEPARDNSLLLNFTISDTTLLLNGHPIVPLASRPPAITAFQIPANTSELTMDNILHLHMLDYESWNVGTSAGTFELQYEHTVLRTKVVYQDILQFDITGIHMRSGYAPRSYNLDKGGQKMVQLLLSRMIIDHKPTLIVKDIEIVERKNKEQPRMMPCGKPAMVKTEYNPLEWDYYGKIGTWERTWTKIPDDIAEFIWYKGPGLVFVSIILGLLCVVRRRQLLARQKATEEAMEDAEAALLGVESVEYEDAPPGYEDAVPLENEKDGQQTAE